MTTPKRVQFFIRKNDNFSRAEQMKNLESGAVKAGSAEYTGKLGTEADSYTKIQLDAKLNRHIKDVVYDAEQARFTFVFEDGREIVVDTPLE